MAVTYSALLHIGRVRFDNQDNLYIDGVMLTPQIRQRSFSIEGSANFPAIFAVCDGMGGEAHGEVASFLAVQTLLQYSESVKCAKVEQLDRAIQGYVAEVNRVIRTQSGCLGQRMGTTLALALITKSGVHCYNLGDSRVYCLRRHVFWQVTNDHTLASEYSRNGFPSIGQAVDRQNGHKLTRCMGIGALPSAEGYPAIEGECRILLCSDGLTDMVGTEQIEYAMRFYDRNIEAANALLTLALENGGSDNTTIIIADVPRTKASFNHVLKRALKHAFVGKLKQWRR